MKEIAFGQWKVTTSGIEPVEGRYPIAKSRLNDKRDGRSDWLLHMAEKEWVNIEEFISAWLAAVIAHKIDLAGIDVVRSIYDARRFARQTAAGVEWEKQLPKTAGLTAIDGKDVRLKGR